MKRLISVAALSLSLLQGGPACFATDGPVTTPFSYTVPAGGLSRTIRIMHVASGTPRLAHMGLHKGGEVIRLDLAAWPGDRVQVMVNGILKDELPVELPQPASEAVVATPAASPAQSLEAPIRVDTATVPLAIEPVSATAAVFPVEPPPASPEQRLVGEKPRRIVSGTAVRLRAMPSVTAAEVGKLALGTIVDELEVGAREEKIGARSSRWYKVALPDGRSGWIFGAFTQPLSAQDRDGTFIRLAQERLALEKQTPNELLELHQFLRSATPSGATDSSRACLEFHALLTLNRYLREASQAVKLEALPPGIAPYAGDLDYSEPAGMYMCKYNIFWNILERLKDHPQADELAWKASQQPIPGETEGFLELMIAQANETSGRYLRAHPVGAHVGEALNNITAYFFVSPDSDTPREPADIPEEELNQRLPEESRQDALNALDLLRAAVDAATDPGRQTLLRRLDGLGERIRSLGK